MKIWSKRKRIIAIFLMICLLMCSTTVAAKTDERITKNQVIFSNGSELLSAQDLPNNIQALLTEKEKIVVYISVLRTRSLGIMKWQNCIQFKP